MAFFQGATRLSHVPSCCESALSVGTDSRVSAKESGVCGVDLDIGAFGLVAQPVEFLSTFKLRLPPLEAQWEHRDSFPDEAGKGTLISK